MQYCVVVEANKRREREETENITAAKVKLGTEDCAGTQQGYVVSMATTRSRIWRWASSFVEVGIHSPLVAMPGAVIPQGAIYWLKVRRNAGDDW